MASLINKSRKPRFDLHLKISDLNNVPLANGVSLVKWHLPHSIHSEHRGRTAKHPVANHRVDYNYAKIIPLRLVIDRSGRLADCPLEFEVVQEFASAHGGRDEKILLGKVTLNLAEYVAESEMIMRDVSAGFSYAAYSDLSGLSGLPGLPGSTGHARNRSSLSKDESTASFPTTTTTTTDSAPTTSAPTSATNPATNSATTSATTTSATTATTSAASASASPSTTVEDGVIRRYLLQDSKINSTLKLSVLMVQTDGDHNFIAPPLKSAPVFGGIAGIMASGEVMGSGVASIDDDDDYSAVGFASGSVLSRSAGKGDMLEAQDVYRRALAASWAGEATELPADECIEDIFSGGDGFRHSDFTGADSAGPASPTYAAGADADGDADYTPRLARRKTSALFSTTSLTSVMEDHSHDHDPDEETGSGGSSGKKSRRLINLPLRRKTGLSQPARKASGGSGLSIPLSLQKRPTVDFETGNNTSSGDDDATSSSSGSRRMASVQGEEDALGREGHATLRPRDFRHMHQSHAFAEYAGMNPTSLHGREDSVLSDRTVRGPGLQKSLPPDMASLLHRGNSSSSRNSRNSRASGGSRVSGGSRTSGTSHTSRARASSPQEERDEDEVRRGYEISEYDVRDNFVAWHLPSSSVRAS